MRAIMAEDQKTFRGIRVFRVSLVQFDLQRNHCLVKKKYVF